MNDTTMKKAEAFADRLLTLALAVPLIILTLLFAGALLGPAGAQESTPETGTLADCGTDLRTTLSEDQRRSIAGTAATIPAGEGLFWKIEKAGVAPSYLLGTIHLPDPRVTRLRPHVAAALEAADRTVLELSEIADPAAMAAAMFTMPDIMMLPDEKTLETILDDAQYRTVADGLATKGIPILAMNRMQPWFISMSLATPSCPALGEDDPAAALDSILAKRTIENGRAVLGLETVDEQLSALASMPLDTQIEQLVATMGYLGDVNDMMETMVRIYEDEEIAALMPTLQALFPDAEAVVGGSEAFAAFEKEIIDKRNELMTERMIPMLEDGNSFIGVGALHLIGKTGIVSGLRERGWTVTRQERGA
ncbi:TraB/GumN family protein [Fulvimarina sp. 2208YS6-2-32]|uniref:TraB/GumN family protein n=1 Tax=Fulvimarina uroteuthidis TaxID=3098149 RepID=A0ABU5I3I1_9HYPH|nr:TraB/GumN family protein [Fulvimarina sp. 2208YS6-2-32]MDY8109374.1 TraB/GumN family protein [Fulvimarina sp. 2208YS6-2-32]